MPSEHLLNVNKTLEGNKMKNILTAITIASSVALASSVMADDNASCNKSKDMNNHNAKVVPYPTKAIEKGTVIIKDDKVYKQVGKVTEEAGSDKRVVELEPNNNVNLIGEDSNVPFL